MLHKFIKNLFNKDTIENSQKEISLPVRPVNLSHARELFKLNKFEEAKEFILKNLESFPKKNQALELLGIIEIKKFNREEAYKYFKESIQLTNAKSSYKKLAGLLIRHAQYEEGLEVLNKMNIEFKVNSETSMFQAELLFLPKRYKEAIEILKSLDESPDANILLSKAYISDKQYEIASQLIEKLETLSASFTEKQIKSMKYLSCWRKYYVNGIDYNAPKVFGIGLSRTATTSLTTALEILGYTTIHFINPITQQIIDKDDFLYFDAFTDSPVSNRFEELYKNFPNAKFIYSERELKDWIRSSTKLYQSRGISTTNELRDWLINPPTNKFDKLYSNYDPNYVNTYKNLYADFPSWEDSYIAFEKRVLQFFSDKPKDKLLRINICEEPEWNKLCDFLNLKVPDQPFPYSHTVKTTK